MRFDTSLVTINLVLNETYTNVPSNAIFSKYLSGEQILYSLSTNDFVLRCGQVQSLPELMNFEAVNSSA